MNKHWWRFVHNCIAHPLLFFTNDSKWAVRLHDWSSLKMPRYKKIGVVKRFQEILPRQHKSFGEITKKACEGLRKWELEELDNLDPDGEDAKAHAFMEKEDMGEMIDNFMAYRRN